MSRRKKGLIPADDEPKLDISSLIDVCFLLLCYFIVTSTIQPKEFDLGLQLPSHSDSDSSDKPDVEPMLLIVKNNGSVFELLNDSKEEVQLEGPAEGSESGRILEQLDIRLQEYTSLISGTQKPLLQMHIEGEAQQQWVVDAMDVIRKNEITSVTFTDLTKK